MRALITGAAGFVGSNLCDQLLAEGHEVVGIDCFTDYYSQDRKHSNLAQARQHDSFTLLEADLLTCDLDPVLDGADVVFHQAGQPGVRLSWADGFETYVQLNIIATQRLLEVAKRKPIDRLVYASSSSVYGSADRYPTLETDVPAPVSPYGVTKLAAEHLFRYITTTLAFRQCHCVISLCMGHDSAPTWQRIGSSIRLSPALSSRCSAMVHKFATSPSLTTSCRQISRQLARPKPSEAFLTSAVARPRPCTTWSRR